MRYSEITEVRAWHGSPHLFKSFNIKKVNSGEGAQAYGWGLYFAQLRDVADYYRKKLGKFTYKGKTIRRNQERLLSAVYQLVNNDFDKEAAIRCDTSVQDLINQIDPADIGFAGGGIYEVELPDESKFLNYDVTFKEQTLYVKKAFKTLPQLVEAQYQNDLARYVKTLISDNDPGKVCYHHIGNFFRNVVRAPDEYKATSLLLLRAGIVGMRYFDGESRDGQEGTYNYVVFDDKLIQIIQHHAA